ncbi:hypothetical protein [Marinomonas ushuaiensis]|nr:hypothetical protein [Marinomonas ushuaiensis]
MKSRQQGWMTIEVILCLALFSVVLHLAQRQSEAQWQSVQLAEEHRKRFENQQKQIAMTQLVGDVLWVKEDKTELELDYPSCQSCSSRQLQDWFRASLHTVSTEESDE